MSTIKHTILWSISGAGAINAQLDSQKKFTILLETRLLTRHVIRKQRCLGALLGHINRKVNHWDSWSRWQVRSTCLTGKVMIHHPGWTSMLFKLARSVSQKPIWWTLVTKLQMSTGSWSMLQGLKVMALTVSRFGMPWVESCSDIGARCGQRNVWKSILSNASSFMPLRYAHDMG